MPKTLEIQGFHDLAIFADFSENRHFLVSGPISKRASGQWKYINRRSSEKMADFWNPCNYCVIQSYSFNIHVFSRRVVHTMEKIHGSVYTLYSFYAFLCIIAVNPWNSAVCRIGQLRTIAAEYKANYIMRIMRKHCRGLSMLMWCSTHACWRCAEYLFSTAVTR